MQLQIAYRLNPIHLEGMLGGVSESTNFLARQDSARRGTRRMVVLFIVGVIATITVVFLIAGGLLGSYDPKLFFWVFLSVGVGILIASLFKASELSQGGKTIALALGGRPIPPNPRDMNERKLRNVVEEMAIASGVPMPELYVLDNEKSINAFAAGYTPADAAIGVTRGAIETLNRDELQGVIAHEFSHILNGDMKLNIRLISLIFGLLFLTVIGRFFFYVRPSGGSRDDKGAGVAFVLIGLVLILVGWLSVFFGKMIQAAVSRQREFLADASAVQFTRNPLGLAAALKKIGLISQHSYIKSPEAEEAAHLFFATGLQGFWSKVFATHPPLRKRIQLLDPSFSGDFSKLDIKRIESRSPEAPPVQAEEKPKPRRPRGVFLPAMVAGLTTESARNLIETLPACVGKLRNDPLGAIALICATLIDEEEEIRQFQFSKIARAYGDSVVKSVSGAVVELQALSRSQKLAVVTVSSPSLKGMSPEQFAILERVLNDLIKANNEVDVFEYCVLKTIQHNLKGYYNPKVKHDGTKTVLDLFSDAQIILSLLARTEGNLGDAELGRAFESGIQSLKLGAREMHLLPLSDCSFVALDQALEHFALEATSLAKEELLTAGLMIIQTTDDQVTEDETNLLTAIAHVIG